MNAILYLLRTGCSWRHLPWDSFPPRLTVYNMFRKFRRNEVGEAIWAELHIALRGLMGGEVNPSAAVFDRREGAVTTARWVAAKAVCRPQT